MAAFMPSEANFLRVAYPISTYLPCEVTLRNQVELVAPTSIASANWSLQVF